MDVSLEKNSNPLVSVIIPNYNHAKYLNERIQSILNQTFQNFEIIILDDKSNDDSLEVINKYREDPHVSHIIVNDANTGKPCMQWKKGITIAKGELIWIAESDDTCSPFFLEKLLALHHSENTVLAFARSQRIDDDGHLYFTYDPGISEGVWNGKDFIASYLGKRCYIVNASSVLFKKKFFASISEDYLNLQGSADWLFWIELCKLGNVGFCGEVLNYMRYHESNATIINSLKGINYFADKKIIDYLYFQGLISKYTYKQNIHYRILEIKSRKFETETIRRDLLNLWGGNTLGYKVRSFLSMVLNKLDCMLWS